MKTRMDVEMHFASKELAEKAGCPGPNFVGALADGTSLDDMGLIVEVDRDKDGNPIPDGEEVTYFYPMHTIGRIKVSAPYEA